MGKIIQDMASPTLRVQNRTSQGLPTPSRGWLFYDGDCGFCTAIVRRLRRGLEGRGYTVAQLQDPVAQMVLKVPADQLLVEMRVVTPTGAQFGGADAVVVVAREFWWLWPLVLLSWIPGGRWLLRVAYREVASRRRCTTRFMP
jgi:predicted DCC family thiol-disulfide oxidoreductase YuxK